MHSRQKTPPTLPDLEAGPLLPLGVGPRVNLGVALDKNERSGVVSMCNLTTPHTVIHNFKTTHPFGVPRM